MDSELINKNTQISEKILLRNETLDTVIQNDSGHESSGSQSTELPSTPEGEQRQHNVFTNTDIEKLNWHDSAETKYFCIKISVPSGESIDVQVLNFINSFFFNVLDM
jgi:hypothetical protein